ncbi:MAG TPA: transketolase [Deltaproteobacteria bacterium]|nr:transketolase [Deltaproteobacteria bacterium]
MTGKAGLEKYLHLSKKVRRSILDMAYRTRSPHIGSCFSSVELLCALYFGVLRHGPDDRTRPCRDRFVMSKGHAAMVLYAVLHEAGFLSDEDIDGFAVNDGVLEQHPTRQIEKGIEVSTGSLGHGLSIGAGMALAAKRDGLDYRVYVLLSDGELNEGSSWEAAMFAAHHGLDNLTAIVDYNKIQALGRTSDIIELEPLAARWKAFGWGAVEVDGHDCAAVLDAYGALPFERGHPSVVIGHTLKGKGISFMEDELLWHYRAPDRDEYERAKMELAS